MSLNQFSQTKRTIFHKPAAKKRVTTPERSVQHELFKEMITCLETQLPDEQTLQLALLPDEKMVLQVPGEEGSFIGRYLLHTDDEVSTVCAHFLQRVVITQPSLRVSVIKAMCAQVLQLSESAEQQHHNIRSALHHLLLLVDLWVFALIRANTREGVPAVPLSLILKLERVALIMMSHWSAAVRGVALDLVHSAQCLATLAVQHSGPDRAHIVTRRLAWVFDRHMAQIVQNARWHFFLYLTNGIDRDVKMVSVSCITGGRTILTLFLESHRRDTTDADAHREEHARFVVESSVERDWSLVRAVRVPTTAHQAATSVADASQSPECRAE
jgi:hypothetical protein